MGMKRSAVCDRCETEQPLGTKHKELIDLGWYTIKLYALAGDQVVQQSITYGTSPLFNFVYCPKCVHALALTNAIRKKAEERAANEPSAPQPPTLEDVIREIVQDELVNSQG